MLIIPAIDLKNGKVVRLLCGKYELETVYSDNPVKIAKKWEQDGARLMHIVDLDGALKGKPQNLDIVKDIIKNVKVELEFGGGVRDIDTVKKLLDLGISKIVVGTKAAEDSKFVKKLGKDFTKETVISIDAANGIVATRGWIKETKENAIDLAKKMQACGIRRINYTEISKDGTLSGPNIESIKKLLGAIDVSKMSLVASGGISSLDDIKQLKAFEPKGLIGVIVGKAIYENKINLKEAIQLC